MRIGKSSREDVSSEPRCCEASELELLKYR